MAENNKMNEMTIEDKLKALNALQKISSELDKIKTLRGELPLEVQDLEDEIVGLQTRVNNYSEEIKQMEESISAMKLKKEEAVALVNKYKEQQENVRNNREYDNLSKEIEFQELEIELADKKTKEFTFAIKNKNEEKEKAMALIADKKLNLDQKKAELDEIIAETKEQEVKLREEAKATEATIEPRLLTAFKRIRKNAHNGLAVVTIERNACGGCFNRIPPQRQLDIRMAKKIIVCEYCGRILIDNDLANGER
ncbi:MAG: hypothetical protein IJ270_02325 [Paludibacteraceae bacterium]|nr:hypothetical protein [Paludibacteraceae bacterium]